MEFGGVGIEIVEGGETVGGERGKPIVHPRCYVGIGAVHWLLGL